MKTMMVAQGPDFKCGHQLEEIRSIDVYPLVCHLLQLQTCHNSPGTLDRTREMLTTDVNCLVKSGSSAVRISGMLFLMMSFMMLDGYLL